MSIPEFPDSREILLDDKPIFDRLFAARPPEISAYTFTNIFAWRESHDAAVSRLGDHLIIHYNPAGRRICLEPLGDGPADQAIEDAFRRSGEHDMEFAYAHSATASLLRGSPACSIELDRDNADYLYLAEDLINLAGRKYDAKRNFINRFRLHNEYEYVTMTQETAFECIEFADYWCEERSCDTVEGLRKERCAVYQMLTSFDALRIRGGAIRVEGRIVAFCLGENLNPETLVVHVEKADPNIEGLYQLVNNEFCAHEATGLNYVNREQDLGVPGLRKAKESYHPVKLVETYRIRRTRPVQKEST